LKQKQDKVMGNDVKILKERLKNIKTGKRDDLICLVNLLDKYGFRIGIFEGMIIDGKGNWHSKSKGKTYEGKFTKKEVEEINKTGLLNKSGWFIKEMYNQIYQETL
jgi:hypothetical protein